MLKSETVKPEPPSCKLHIGALFRTMARPHGKLKSLTPSHEWADSVESSNVKHMVKFHPHSSLHHTNSMLDLGWETLYLNSVTIRAKKTHGVQ